MKEEDKLNMTSADEEIPFEVTASEEEDGAAEVEEGSAGHNHPTLKEVIAENAREDELPSSSSFTLRKILGGDILNANAIRRQVWLILLITLFVMLYISNRYNCQEKQVQIDKLTTAIDKLKYKSLSTASMLTEKSMESHVVEMLRENNDTVIHSADQPPYIIMVDEK